jgi:general secretion pathway protein K
MAWTKRDRGFALLLVLITLATLSLVIAASIDASHRFGGEASARIANLRLRAAAAGAFWTAARDLAEAGAAAPAMLTKPQSYVLDGVRLTVSARSETGKIDINAASPEMIASLLAQSGLSPEHAARLAAEIADWRDKDDDTRKNGAETAEYLGAGRSYGPTNRDFESVSELALVLDGGVDLVTCLARDVTVFTHSADIDPEAASPLVLRAAKIAPGALGPSGFSIVGGRTVEIGSLTDVNVSAVDESTGRFFTEETTVRLTGSGTDPVWIVSRVSPGRDEADAHTACKRLDKQLLGHARP